MFKIRKQKNLQGKLITTLYDLALVIGIHLLFEVMQAGFSVLLGTLYEFLYEFKELIHEASENRDLKKN